MAVRHHRRGDPFPYNPAKAKSLLSSHGWTVTPNGTTDTCTDSAKCGPGISKGSTLSANYVYESGVSWVGSEMTPQQSNAATDGIKLNLIPKPFPDVISVSGGNCVVTKSSCAGTSRTGASAGRSRPTTCRPVTSCSSVARSRTPVATATRTTTR